jgi:hypothetical protein
MIIHRSGIGTLLGVTIGMSTEDSSQIRDQFIKECKELNWSIISPEIQCHIVNHSNVDPKDKSLLDRLLVNASQFTTL